MRSHDRTQPADEPSVEAIRTGDEAVFTALAQRHRHELGRFWFPMYWRMVVSDAPPQDPAKWGPDRKCPPHEYRRMCVSCSWRIRRP
ncbi:hypothetical protein [Streptomyces sp. NPDC048057]|uniref:hypothetical protein n=1 Tax=Streptomyces sp. NPDC048057 TaxID=3155628 RepID=UPI0033E7C2F4